MSAASVAVPPQPDSATKPRDFIPGSTPSDDQPPANSPASRSKSLRPLFDQVTSTGTAPPSTADTDIIWSRITFDGTTLTMKRLVNNSSTPTESDWSSATVNFTSTAFAGGGGRLGFVPTGTGSIDNLTVQSWNGSSWTTEAVDNFTVDSSGYAADTPTYDSNGNLTYDGTQSYTYDAWNRLIKISHAYRALTADGGDGNVHSGQVFETNTYDAAGRRIIKAILGTGPQDCTYHYYLSGNNIIEEQNGSAQTINQNVWGLEYIDELVQTSFNSDPADQSTCDTPYWVMQDANYNVLGVCDSSGILRERYEYSAYGQRQTFYSTGSNDPGCYSPTSLAQLCEFGFQGLMHDQPAGLLYERGNYIQATLGRHLSPDALWPDDSINAYEYTRSNPLTFTDPSGQFSWAGAWETTKGIATNLALASNLPGQIYMTYEGFEQWQQTANAYQREGAGWAGSQFLGGTMTAFSQLPISGSIVSGMEIHDGQHLTGANLGGSLLPLEVDTRENGMVLDAATVALAIRGGFASCTCPKTLRIGKVTVNFPAAEAPRIGGPNIIGVSGPEMYGSVPRTGDFSIANWTGYPSGLTQPAAPFRILSGTEYAQARAAANATNAAIRRQLPLWTSAGLEWHEIKPVKFCGSPTDLANKVPLPKDFHRTSVTPWWGALQNLLDGK